MMMADSSIQDSQHSTAGFSDTNSESSLTDSSVPADGELNVLLESLDEPSAPLTKEVEQVLTRTLSGALSSHSGESIYGQPLSPEEAEKKVPPGGGGLIWHATIIPDNFLTNGKLRGGLNQRDFDVENRTIKPRRPSLPVTASDFFSSLTKVDGPDGPRYIFHGILNGWPSLRYFELVALEQRRQSHAIPTPKDLMSGQILWVNSWHSEKEGKKGIEPKLQATDRVYRATLRGPPWTSKGWSKESPGFAFWFEAQSEAPRLVYGTDMPKKLSYDCKCTNIHMISHRYGKPRESPRDKLIYHSICLLEWDHGEYTTVLEAAYLNGMGGYKGKCNWYEDRDDEVTKLYRALPPEMVSPWHTNKAEIRAYDIPSKTLDDFKDFIRKYQGGPNGRFIDPHFTFSHKARLTFRTKAHIAQYLLNYISRDSSYGELKRNCQTFTADLCSFIAGKKDIVPFHPVSRMDYHNRTYLFLYDSDMYESKQDKKGTQRPK